jgi:hypothetical protein
VFHIGDDWQIERSGLFASRACASQFRAVSRRRIRNKPQRGGAAGVLDVSRERLGRSVYRDDGRREACLLGAPSRR